jgi:hypothetical protein
MKIEARRPSETLVDLYLITGQHIPEGGSLQMFALLRTSKYVYSLLLGNLSSGTCDVISTPKMDNIQKESLRNCVEKCKIITHILSPIPVLVIT